MDICMTDPCVHHTDLLGHEPLTDTNYRVIQQRERGLEASVGMCSLFEMEGQRKNV